MSAKGQLSHIGIGKETIFGTAVPVTDYLKFNSESITEAREELVSAQMPGRRDEPESYEGLNTISGETVHEVHPKGLGHLLRSWFGEPVTTLIATGVYQHIFTPTNTPFSADCDTHPYTLEIHRDLGSNNAFQYAGCVINTLAFSFGVGAKIMGLTASWLVKNVANIVKTTPVLETTEPFRWNQAIISIGTEDSGTATGTQSGTTLQDTGKSWTVDQYKNHYVRLTGGTGLGQVRKIVSNTADTLTVSAWGTEPVSGDTTYEIYASEEKLETLSLTLENGLVGIPLINNTKVIAKIVGDAFRSGTIAPTFHTEDLSQYNMYKNWLTKKWYLTFTGATISGNWKYELEFQLPKVLFTAFPLNVAGPGRITVGASGKIKYDNTAAHLCRIRLVNDIAAY